MLSERWHEAVAETVSQRRFAGEGWTFGARRPPLLRLNVRSRTEAAADAVRHIAEVSPGK
jgi:hypothetical protein